MQALWLLSPCLDHVFDLSTLLALHRDPSSTKELPNAVSHARSHAKIASINGEFDRPTVYALLCSFTAFFVTGDNALVAWRRQGTTACTISMVRERETKKYRIEPQYVPRIHQQKPQTPWKLGLDSHSPTIAACYRRFHAHHHGALHHQASRLRRRTHQTHRPDPHLRTLPLLHAHPQYRPRRPLPHQAVHLRSLPNAPLLQINVH